MAALKAEQKYRAFCGNVLPLDKFLFVPPVTKTNNARQAKKFRIVFRVWRFSPLPLLILMNHFMGHCFQQCISMSHAPFRDSNFVGTNLAAHAAMVANLERVPGNDKFNLSGGR